MNSFYVQMLEGLSPYLNNIFLVCKNEEGDSINCFQLLNIEENKSILKNVIFQERGDLLSCFIKKDCCKIVEMNSKFKIRCLMYQMGYDNF